DKSNIIKLYIEDKKYFRKIITELNEQINGNIGKFIMSEDDREILISKNVDIIIDFLNTNPNNKKVINRLLSELTENAKIEYEKLNIIINQLNIFFDDLLFSGDFELEREDDIKVEELIKLGGFYFNFDYGNTIDRLISYMVVLRKYIGIKLFILINIEKILTVCEMKEFFEYCIMNEFKVLFIESGKADYENLDLKYIKRYIIDEDLCDLY
ncbi:type II-A CRISPR-associated protein Csn2, partial [Peptoniphilus sp. oral taxon 386]|uniref:type II-A CRISPR-associated protein Csn2 n=1 Tax=Peptoniphilus sp. oral taxon 386 TaxID=652713 RepID=UPI00159E508D